MSRRYLFGALFLGAALAVVALMWLGRPMTGRSYERVRIPAGDYDLGGYLSPGHGSEGPWLIFVHGNRPEGQNHPLYLSMLTVIDPDVTVLAIDLRGFGQSPAQDIPETQNQFDRLTDIQAAADYLMSEHGAQADRIVLAGHSLGALQVLQAAGAATFQRVIALGPANFSLFVDDPQATRAYLSKYEENTGIRIPEDTFREEASRFVPGALFEPCPETPIVLVFGQLDIREGLDKHRSSIPENCLDSIEWKIIPLADHMYFSEETRLPAPLARALSRTFVRLLAWRLDGFSG